MHLMPYIDSLWFGEGYNYDEPPEYWLIEMSGIAFGLMGDMMHAGNMWRGMLYGMTTRFRCADPQPVWQVWDAFGIDSAEMVGYWEPASRRPVTVSCTEGGATPTDAVLATVYVRRGNATLVSLASWASGVARCELQPYVVTLQPRVPMLQFHTSRPQPRVSPGVSSRPAAYHPLYVSPGASCASTWRRWASTRIAPTCAHRRSRASRRP